MLASSEYLGSEVLSVKGRKFYTIMIVPHADKETVTLRIPVFAIGVFMTLCVALLFMFVMEYHDHNRMKKENQLLVQYKEEADLLRRELTAVSSQLAQIESYALALEQIELQIREERGWDAEKVVAVNPIDKDLLTSRDLLKNRDKNVVTVASFVINDTKTDIAQLNQTLPVQQENMSLLLDQLAEDNQRISHTPSIWPAEGKVTSKFGYRKSPFSGRREFHDGLDIANRRNTPIIAAADGAVVYAQYQSGYGKQIMIKHGYGLKTSYSHLSSYAVSSGEKVKKGEVIGYMGSTGWSTGNHLHYMVYRNGVPVDPIDYLP